jgi:hypothetical protein
MNLPFLMIPDAHDGLGHSRPAFFEILCVLMMKEEGQ